MKHVKPSVLIAKINGFKAGADQARERMAALAFDLEVVIEAMARAASTGHRAIKITPPIPLELSATEAARSLVDQLREAGVNIEWVPRSPTDPTAGERFSELVLRW